MEHPTKQLVLRKGKTIIKAYSSAYAIAEDQETLHRHFGQNADTIAHFLAQNAFGLCIIGSKARLGNGYIVEMRNS